MAVFRTCSSSFALVGRIPLANSPTWRFSRGSFQVIDEEWENKQGLLNRGKWCFPPPPKKAGSFIVSEDWTNMILFESSGLLRREGLVLNTRFLKQIWTSAGKMGKYFKRCAAISPWAMFTNSSKDTHLLFFFFFYVDFTMPWHSPFHHGHRWLFALLCFVDSSCIQVSFENARNSTALKLFSL